MGTKAVIGLGFGDEGKGITTDYLCSLSDNPLVVRFSGGQQAGHNVVLNGVSHVFSNFGSGSLRGAPTYWAKYCTVEPTGLINELDILIKKGVSPRLYIDDKCPITTPYDIYSNHVLEVGNKHGSCGLGVGATINREENHYSLTFGDLFYPSVFNMKMEAIRKFYGFKGVVNLDRFYECINIIPMCDNIKPIFSEKWTYPTYNIPEDSDDIILEGSQGLLLDQSIGFFPHVTRSNTGSKNILDAKFNPELYMITRAYQTRHGNGPMTNENTPHNIAADPEETNVYNAHQGNFRRTLLDLDLLSYGISKDEYVRTDGSKNLVITCLDHVEDEYRFTHKGRIEYCSNEGEFVERINSILGFKNVYISKSRESKNIVKL